MFPKGYFPKSYFDGDYFPKGVAATPPAVAGGGYATIGFPRMRAHHGHSKQLPIWMRIRMGLWRK